MLSYHGDGTKLDNRVQCGTMGKMKLFIYPPPRAGPVQACPSHFTPVSKKFLQSAGRFKLIGSFDLPTIRSTGSHCIFIRLDACIFTDLNKKIQPTTNNQPMR